MVRIAAEECSSLNGTEVFEAYSSRKTALGELPIWRALPVRNRRLIGPWCFLDRYGPLSFTAEKPMDVAPHPHIGLQTVSWLLEGEVLHRDSLGYEAMARPGGVSVMTSGSGIAHSEETPGENSGRLSGLQLWIALPEAHRHVEPSFQHVEEAPSFDVKGADAKLIVGTYEGLSSPAVTYSDSVGLDVQLQRGAAVQLATKPEREYGLILVDGDAHFEDQRLGRNTLYYVGCGRTVLPLRSATGGRLVIVGGIPFAEKILMWWNFVARSPEEIAEARAKWESGAMGEVKGYAGPRLAAPPLSRIARPNPAS